MKHTLFLTTMLAAALLGGQVFAETYSVKDDWIDVLNVQISDTEATIRVDAQKTLVAIYAGSESLTLDYQGEFVLTTSYAIDTPNNGVLNITSTVDAVKTKWEDAFSVEGGGSITLCSSKTIEGTHGPVQFFGKEANNTVQLGDSEVMFKGVVADLSALDMNQVGVVWGKQEVKLVGKVGSSPVPEPTTGTLSLLALAGLCIRRRK